MTSKKTPLAAAGRDQHLCCPRLPDYDDADLAAVHAAFGAAPELQLRQAWLPAPEPDFLPGTVRVGWREETLLVLAELEDADIFTRATALNQRTWELGDAFEIFLKSPDLEEYVEFHVTPNNQRLQLRFPSTAALRAAQRSGEFDRYLLAGSPIRSWVWLQPEARRWFSFAAVPAATVWGPGRQMAGRAWRFSFSRYDYTRGNAQPVVSSTSPHREPDFHSQAEWGTLEFKL